MTLQQMEYIVALDTHRHFVRAAESCFVTQPTLTMQVKKLEDETGIVVFDRDKKPLEPTPAGKEMIARAREILRQMKGLREFIQEEKEEIKGTFRIGIIPTLAPYLLPRFIPDFVKVHPNIHLQIREIQTDAIIDELKNDQLDIGILVTPLHEGSIREIPVFQEAFLLYHHPKEFRKSKSVSSDDLDTDRLLLLEEGHCFREQALKICKRKSGTTDQHFQYESGSLESLKELVKKGMGMTLVSELSIDLEKEKKYLKRFSAPEPVREVSLVVHHSFPKERLLNLLRDAIHGSLPEKMIRNRTVKKIKWR